MFDVTIYTDGACSGNPGVGGYGAILNFNGYKKVVCGCCPDVTTNNRMELTAVIEAIKALKKPSNVTVYTDSQYICDGSLKDKDWFKTAERKNKDLWIELITVSWKGEHKIKFVKVAGHAGDKMNEECDRIAKEQCIKAKHQLIK